MPASPGWRPRSPPSSPDALRRLPLAQRPLWLCWRLGLRLSFISSVARLWQLAASFALAEGQKGDEFREIISRWIQQAADHRARLREFLDAVSAFPLPTPSGDHDSMVEYDRLRLIKESILEQGIVTSVDVSDAIRVLAAAAYDGAHDLQAATGALELGDDVARVCCLRSCF